MPEIKELLGKESLLAIKDYIDSNSEKKSNKVTSLSASSTDTQYPSAKVVYDELQTKQENLVSGTNIKTINGTSVLGAGNIAIKEENQYFAKFVSGANIDSQFVEGEEVYCTEGSITRGGSVPSTLTISLPQTYGSGGAIYLHTLYLRYIDKNSVEQVYTHTFASGGVADFTAYGQTATLSGMSWLLTQTNTGASAPTASNAKPTGSSIVCLKCGAGASGTTTRNLTLSTEDLGGCTLLEARVGVCTTTTGVVNMSIRAANDDWFYNDGTAQTQDLTYKIMQSKSATPYTGEEVEFTNEPDGTELGEATIITFSETFLHMVGEDLIEDAPEEEVIYVCLDDNKLYRFNGTTLIEVSKVLELGLTDSTAYRGDYGQQNHNDIVTANQRIAQLVAAKPKSRKITILTSDWVNASYSVSLDPITVGEFDAFFVTPDDTSAQEYYDCGITRNIEDPVQEGDFQTLVFTAATVPSNPLTIQLIYIQCEEF